MSESPRAVAAEPEAVERFAGILADWLASYTVPGPLGAEMADALARGSPWVAAIAAGAVRRTGWPDPQAVAWGICVGALTAAFEAAGRSLDGEVGGREPGSTADGPARALLAADGLIAAAHEAVSSLDPERLDSAITALHDAFRDGGPWQTLAAQKEEATGRVPWPRFVALALAPAAADAPTGPWRDLAAAWRTRHEDARSTSADPGDRHEGGAGRDDEPLWRHPAVDRSMSSLLQAAAKEARRGTSGRTGNGA